MPDGDGSKMAQIRIDKYLADMGIGTRSEVKKILKSGQVTLNGEKIKKPEQKINSETDQIFVNQKPVIYQEFEYYMLNKAGGVVSATKDKKEKTVLDCIASKKRKDLFPVGRLDKDTEGLLLITNDGELAHRLLSPKKHVDKTYFVILREALKKEYEETLETGIDIGEETLTLPAKLEICSEDRKSCLLTIHEGKFHQVKRMFQAAENEVIFLKRMSMGSLKLDETLKPGEYRSLTKEEIERLKEKC